MDKINNTLKFLFAAVFAAVMFMYIGIYAQDDFLPLQENVAEAAENALETPEVSEPQAEPEQQAEPESPTDSISKDSNSSVSADELLNILIPLDIKFVINPFEKDGKDTLYSDEFEIKNYSSKDVCVDLTSVCLNIVEGKNVIAFDDFFPKYIDEGHAKIYVAMSFDNGSIIPVTPTESAYPEFIRLGAANYSEDGEFESFNEDSTISFRFIGDVELGDESLSDSDIVAKIGINYYLSGHGTEIIPAEESETIIEEDSEMQDFQDLPDGEASTEEADVSEEEISTEESDTEKLAPSEPGSSENEAVSEDIPEDADIGEAVTDSDIPSDTGAEALQPSVESASETSNDSSPDALSDSATGDSGDSTSGGSHDSSSDDSDL